MSTKATYGLKVITKTNSGYKVDGKTYPSLSAATDAIDKGRK